MFMVLRSWGFLAVVISFCWSERSILYYMHCSLSLSSSTSIVWDPFVRFY
jgi:hypothetical protein